MCGSEEMRLADGTEERTQMKRVRALKLSGAMERRKKEGSQDDLCEMII